MVSMQQCNTLGYLGSSVRRRVSPETPCRLTTANAWQSRPLTRLQTTSTQVTAVARQALRRAVIEADPRLVEAMFLCEVAAASDVLSGATVSDLLASRQRQIIC